MFHIRPLESDAIKVRQSRQMIQIVASNDDIPLKANWLKRWCTLPREFGNVYKRIFNFETRTEDVYVLTFMKCGTTWMQETLWLLMNNLDFKTAESKHLMERTVFIDISGLYNMPFDSIAKCDSMPNPRLIKSHLPANLLPKELWQKKPKIVYVARNVKDVIISSFHFVQALDTWHGSLDEYIEDFMNNAIMYTPFWEQVVDFWKMRHEPYIFFTTYEEMKQDLAGVIQKLCKFLERPQLSDVEMKAMLEHLSFENMKANKSVNLTEMIKTVPKTREDDNFNFMRRGIVGSYKDELTKELQEKLNNWTKDILSKYGLKECDIFDGF